MPQADLAGVRIYYEVDGDSAKPCLALSNSLGTNLHLWDRVVPVLAPHFRLLRYDTRGHGRSSSPPTPWTIQSLASDVLCLLDHLMIRRCSFCGISLGGMTGMGLGIHAPERIEKLVLANTGARIGTREGWNDRIRSVQSEGLEAISGPILERWFTPEFRRACPAEVEAMRAMLVGTPAEGYAGCSAAIRDANLTADLHRINAQVLVVAGTHDLSTPLSDSRVLCQAIPRSRCITLTAAHLSPVEQPEEFATAVISFLRCEEA